MSENNFNYKKLTPFKWFMLENFPFIEADFDALTNWQLFCKLGNEMNKIINNVNSVGQQTQTLTDFVTNYFDNLDVQDEIDHKLDEMVESGELQEIITAYLQMNTILTFNTVADMKSSSVLSTGMTAKTLGYTQIGDGYDGIYVISNSVSNNDIAETLNSGLYAKKIFDKENPSINDFRKFCTTSGSYLNWTAAFNFALSKFNSIKLGNKTYYINDTLSIDREGVTIEGNSTLSSRIALIPTSQMSTNYILKLLENNIEIRNLYIQGSNNNDDYNNSGVYISGSQIKLTNIKIRHMKGYGISFNFPSYDCVLDTIQVYDCTATGMVIHGTHCQFVNSFVHDLDRHGFEILRGSNFFDNCKAYLTGKVNAESIVSSDTGIGFFIHTAGSHTCMLTNCHAQECGYDGFKISNTKCVTLENCISDSNSVYLDGVGINIVNSDYNVLKNCLIVNKAVLTGWTKTALNVYGYYNNIDVTINTIDYSQQGYDPNTKFFTNILGGTNYSSTNKILINNNDYLPLDYQNPLCFDTVNNSISDDFSTYASSGVNISTYIQRNNKYQVFSIQGTTAVDDEVGLALERKTLKASITKVDVSFLRKCSKENGLVVGCKIQWYDSNNDLISTTDVENIPIYQSNNDYKTRWTEFYNTFDKPETARNYILSIYLKVKTSTIVGSANIKDLKILYS